MNSIKTQIKVEIELKRNELKRQIAYLKARSRRKKMELQQQIKNVRGKMAKELMKANKHGNMMHCKKRY